MLYKILYLTSQLTEDTEGSHRTSTLASSCNGEITRHCVYEYKWKYTNQPTYQGY